MCRPAYVSLAYIEDFGPDIDEYKRNRLRRLVTCTRHGRVSAEWVEKQTIPDLRLLVEVIEEMVSHQDPIGDAMEDA